MGRVMKTQAGSLEKHGGLEKTIQKNVKKIGKKDNQGTKKVGQAGAGNWKAVEN